MSLLATASQTAGPFFSIGCRALEKTNLVSTGVTGEQVTIQGRVLDGDGKAVYDALIEIWQADAHGKYAHPEDSQNKPADSGFRGFGRVATDEQGAFSVTTIKPGQVPCPGGSLQAPHIVVTVFMRGLLKHLLTRIYFPGDSANESDSILNLVPPERRSTLIAKPVKGTNTLEWNVILQGEDETVFFDF